MRVDLHPDARAEFRAATLWYEERRDQLGDEFVTAIAAMLERIGHVPESFPPWPGVGQTSPSIRKAAVGRFPYLIAFEQHENFVLVLGIAHEKRRPLYWLGRAGHRNV